MTEPAVQDGTRRLVSIVVPALDEFDNVPAVLQRMVELGRAHATYGFELVLVDDGTAREFDGSLDDYIAFVLKGDPAKPGMSKAERKADKKAAAERRDRDAALRKTVRELEAEIARLTAERSGIERAMSDPNGADPRWRERRQPPSSSLSPRAAAASRPSSSTRTRCPSASPTRSPTAPRARSACGWARRPPRWSSAPSSPC